MSPPRLDRDVLVRRLRLIDEALSQLEALRGVGADRLQREPLTRAAAERLLQVVVDLAIDVNAHVVVGLGNAAPETGRRSFEAVAAAGVIEVDLADAMAPAAGMRNVLVHRYIEIDVDVVAASIDSLLDLGPRYTAQVAAFLRTST